MRNKIFNEKCEETIKKLDENSIDCVITSPPYNTGGRGEYWENKIVNGKRVYSKKKRYDKYSDKMSEDSYIDFIVKTIDSLDRPLVKDGTILMNISYGNENPNEMWLLISDIIRRTEFCVADCIVWKKSSAIPNSTSKNKLTRICEFIFVIVRKSELNTFESNKKVITESARGQKFYEVFFNIIEAKNNDQPNNLNNATYSSELVYKLIRMYVKKQGALIYDPFMGTGTTAIGCINSNNNYVGSEISVNQCQYAENRIKKNNLPLFAG